MKNLSNKPFQTVGKIVLIRGGRLILDFDEDVYKALVEADEKRRESTRQGLKAGAYNKVIREMHDDAHIKNPKCKKCKTVELAHISDNTHFHYICPKCNKEYDLDGSTWKF